VVVISISPRQIILLGTLVYQIITLHSSSNNLQVGSDIMKRDIILFSVSLAILTTFVFAAPQNGKELVELPGDSSKELQVAYTDLEERGIGALVGGLIGLALPIFGVSNALAAGVGALVNFVWEGEATCSGGDVGLCLTNIVGAWLSTIYLGFKVKSGFGKRDEVSFLTMPTEMTHHSWSGQNYERQFYRTGNQTTTEDGFTHIGHYNPAAGANGSVINIHYKQSINSINGKTLHHLRHGWNPSSTVISKRVEDSDGGVVGDYLWQDGNTGEFQGVTEDNSESAFLRNGVPSVVDNFEDPPNIASCFSMGSLSTDDAGTWTSINDGVTAFGWNNKPFGFNGRSEGWVEGCTITDGTSTSHF
jgi:hypothetical protein